MNSWHREVGTRVFVLDEQSRILLVEMQDRERGGSYWILPGGQVDDGEQAIDGAVREVEEETGLTITIDRLLYLVDSVEPQVPQLCYTLYFLAHPVSGQRPVIGFDPERAPHQQVLSGARFFTQAELCTVGRVYPEVLREEFWRMLAQGFGAHNPYRRWPAGGSF